VVLISSVLRLGAFLDLVLGETSEKRASLAHTLNYQLTGGTEGVPDDGRARLRVEYMSHAGDFLGCDAGLGLESCLSLSLPGQPHGMQRIHASSKRIAHMARRGAQDSLLGGGQVGSV
jgi:hypothetical protein